MTKFLLIIFILLSSLFSGEIFALTQYRAPTRDEVIRAAAPCKSTGSKIPINDKYVCPGGDFSSSSQAMSDNRIECAIQIALSFAAIDEIGKNWIRQLQSGRWKGEEYNIAIAQTIYDGSGSLSSQYESVCKKSTYDISNFSTSTDPNRLYGCARTTDFFPIPECESIASKKTRMWDDSATIIMAVNVPKTYQNEKDTFMSQVKDNYEKILDKFYRYKLMLGNAVGKFTAYIKNAVK